MIFNHLHLHHDQHPVVIRTDFRVSKWIKYSPDPNTSRTVMLPSAHAECKFLSAISIDLPPISPCQTY
jgi:hypothetical protein